MNRWLAVPVVLALVLAGCGQNASEVEPPEADPLNGDCVLATELVANSKGANLYEAQEFAARAWPQADDPDLKVIIKSISDAGGRKRAPQVNLAF
jgi:hypothetical protein